MRPPTQPVVALDYTAAAGHAPGVGRYVRELVRALIRVDEPATLPLRLVELGRGPRPMAGPPLGFDGPDVRGRFEHARLRVPRRALAALSRTPGFTRACVVGNAELFHRVHADWPPIGRARSSIAVAEFPEEGSDADERLAAATGQAVGVIVFSSDAAARVGRRYDVTGDRIYRVPVGSEHWERDLGDSPDRRTSHDVLVLGAVRASRRPLDVLRGFEALRATGRAARLLVVGRPGDAAPEFESALRASAAAGDVRWIDAPEESRMPRCVAGASVLLHLADDEASPVTPLEATRMGLPVVASPLPAFREALEERARWVDASDAAAVAAALGAALDEAADPGTRDSLRDLALPFTWSSCALAHVSAWRSMMRAPAT